DPLTEELRCLGSASSGTELMDGILELQGGINVQGETLIVHPYIEQENLIRSVSGGNTWTGTWHFDPICPPIVTEPGSTLRMTGVLSGAGGIHKEGAGILILAGANTFDGPVHVEEGTLRLEHSLALGSTALGTELHGGSVELAGGITVANETLEIVDGTSNIRSVSGANTWTGAWNIEPTSSPIIEPTGVPIVVEAGSTFAASGVLSGVGGLLKDGAGTLILSGANTYAGVTRVAEGVLNVRSNLALGSTAGNTEVFTGATLGLRDGITVTGEELVLHATSKLQSSGGSNTWTGATRLLNDPPIDVDTGSVLDLEGEIIGTENLEKLGAGTLIFSGDSPDYTGTLLINEGTVLVNGDQPNSPVIVNGGSLSGSGVVGPVTFGEESLGGAILQSSPVHPGQIDLVVGGTAGADSIDFLPGSTAGTVEVVMSGVSLGSFSPTGRLIAHGLGGDDDLEAAGSLALSAWLYGGEDHDRLKGGAGHDVLLGGDGDDLLIGGQGRDLLIGGIGADRIIGNADEDLLIAGFSDSDESDAALAAVMAEWTSARSYALRVANLTSGSGSVDRLNGSYFLNSQTVHDDDDADVLTGSAGTDWFFADFTRDKVTDG
ncbi:MAG TPA: autotransporter-associated beta strand repeat-containing protein, partial [Planctomycetaceae bacterium]|nr:autotransporter-associated beta strand repeat-containing protein [Planctomycetaceae bacterium]